MNTLVIVLIAAVCLAAAYMLYGRWLAKKWGIDPKAKTPAVVHNDGQDYVPTDGWTVFAHQFSSIAGAGPVTGAIQAAVFGWVPVFLWIVIGGIFFGAVTDFGALYASVKNDGKSMGLLIEKYIGKTGRKLFLGFCWLFCLIVIAAFADMVAGTFNAYTVTDGVETLVDGATVNGAAGSISIFFILFAVVVGLIQHKLKLTGWKEIVLGLVFTILSFICGMNLPVLMGKDEWVWFAFAFIFVASVLPMWLLMQPRDFMSTFMFVGMILGAVLGLIFAHPTMNLQPFTGFQNAQLGTLFPILFVTIACGAVSGFHSLVSSGTSSKMISSEKDMRLVGYGSMCVEVVLGVVSLIVVCAAASNGVLPSGTPFQTFSGSVAAFLTEIFGVPHQIAACILTMCVSALALTSVDAVARIGRMSLQELFMPEPGKEKTAVQKLFTNTVFSTCLTLLAGYALCIAGYMSVWPLVGSANQLLSALVLTGLAVFLKSTGRKGWMLYAPMTIMFAVTMTALVQAVIRIIGAWMDGTFVWMIHGLQFVVAAALIVLALLVVYHCVLKLRDAAPIVKRN